MQRLRTLSSQPQKQRKDDSDYHDGTTGRQRYIRRHSGEGGRRWPYPQQPQPQHRFERPQEQQKHNHHHHHHHRRCYGEERGDDIVWRRPLVVAAESSLVQRNSQEVVVKPNRSRGPSSVPTTAKRLLDTVVEKTNESEVSSTARGYSISTTAIAAVGGGGATTTSSVTTSTSKTNDDWQSTALSNRTLPPNNSRKRSRHNWQNEYETEVEQGEVEEGLIAKLETEIRREPDTSEQFRRRHPSVVEKSISSHWKQCFRNSSNSTHTLDSEYNFMCSGKQGRRRRQSGSTSTVSKMSNLHPREHRQYVHQSAEQPSQSSKIPVREDGEIISSEDVMDAGNQLKNGNQATSRTFVAPSCISSNLSKCMLEKNKITNNKQQQQQNHKRYTAIAIDGEANIHHRGKDREEQQKSTKQSPQSRSVKPGSEDVGPYVAPGLVKSAVGTDRRLSLSGSAHANNISNNNKNDIASERRPSLPDLLSSPLSAERRSCARIRHNTTTAARSRAMVVASLPVQVQSPPLTTAHTESRPVPRITTSPRTLIECPNHGPSLSLLPARTVEQREIEPPSNTITTAAEGEQPTDRSTPMAMPLMERPDDARSPSSAVLITQSLQVAAEASSCTHRQLKPFPSDQPSLQSASSATITTTMGGAATHDHVDDPSPVAVFSYIHPKLKGRFVPRSVAVVASKHHSWCYPPLQNNGGCPPPLCERAMVGDGTLALDHAGQIAVADSTTASSSTERSLAVDERVPLKKRRLSSLLGAATSSRTVLASFATKPHDGLDIARAESLDQAFVSSAQGSAIQQQVTLSSSEANDRTMEIRQATGACDTTKEIAPMPSRDDWTGNPLTTMTTNTSNAKDLSLHVPNATSMIPAKSWCQTTENEPCKGSVAPSESMQLKLESCPKQCDDIISSDSDGNHRGAVDCGAKPRTQEPLISCTSTAATLSEFQTSKAEQTIPDAATGFAVLPKSVTTTFKSVPNSDVDTGCTTILSSNAQGVSSLGVLPVDSTKRKRRSRWGKKVAVDPTSGARHVRQGARVPSFSLGDRVPASNLAGDVPSHSCSCQVAGQGVGVSGPLMMSHHDSPSMMSNICLTEQRQVDGESVVDRELLGISKPRGETCGIAARLVLGTEIAELAPQIDATIQNDNAFTKGVFAHETNKGVSVFEASQRSALTGRAVGAPISMQYATSVTADSGPDRRARKRWSAKGDDSNDAVGWAKAVHVSDIHVATNLSNATNLHARPTARIGRSHAESVEDIPRLTNQVTGPQLMQAANHDFNRECTQTHIAADSGNTAAEKQAIAPVEVKGDDDGPASKGVTSGSVDGRSFIGTSLSSSMFDNTSCSSGIKVDNLDRIPRKQRPLTVIPSSLAGGGSFFCATKTESQSVVTAITNSEAEGATPDFTEAGSIFSSSEVCLTKGSIQPPNVVQVQVGDSQTTSMLSTFGQSLSGLDPRTDPLKSASLPPIVTVMQKKELESHASQSGKSTQSPRLASENSVPCGNDCEDVSLVQIGSRVAVYWDGEDHYFKGYVTEQRIKKQKNFGSTRTLFFVEYDDGDEEWIDLSKNRFRLIVKRNRLRKFKRRDAPMPDSVELKSIDSVDRIPKMEPPHANTISSGQDVLRESSGEALSMRKAWSARNDIAKNFAESTLLQLAKSNDCNSVLEHDKPRGNQLFSLDRRANDQGVTETEHPSHADDTITNGGSGGKQLLQGLSFTREPDTQQGLPLMAEPSGVHTMVNLHSKGLLPAPALKFPSCVPRKPSRLSRNEQPTRELSHPQADRFDRNGDRAPDATAALEVVPEKLEQAAPRENVNVSRALKIIIDPEASNTNVDIFRAKSFFSPDLHLPSGSALRPSERSLSSNVREVCEATSTAGRTLGREFSERDDWFNSCLTLSSDDSSDSDTDEEEVMQWASKMFGIPIRPQDCDGREAADRILSADENDARLTESTDKLPSGDVFFSPISEAVKLGRRKVCSDPASQLMAPVAVGSPRTKKAKLLKVGSREGIAEEREQGIEGDPLDSCNSGSLNPVPLMTTVSCNKTQSPKADAIGSQWGKEELYFSIEAANASFASPSDLKSGRRHCGTATSTVRHSLGKTDQGAMIVKKREEKLCALAERDVKRRKEECRDLTTDEIRYILGEDDHAPSEHWVRRSMRQPSRGALHAPKAKALFERLRNNDPDMVVLKMKKYLSDPDTPQLVINAALDALEENTNCEALYIQNFNEGMRDEQVLRLLQILQQPSCKIWCINIGETYNVKRKTWKRFAKGLKDSNITHMYASEHTISADLKEFMRAAIRDNRNKHSMHIDPNNLDTIVRCTHCWWNPINAKVLRPYLRKRGYEYLLHDAEAQGLRGSNSGATLT